MLTSTQIGAIGEALAALGLMRESAGRLSPFKPLADDGGVDLLMLDNETGRTVPLQVKTRTKRLHGRNAVHFEIRRVALQEYPSGYLLGLLLNEGLTEVLRAWLVPFAEVPRVSRPGKEKFVLRPSASNDSQDRYTPYRYDDLVAVATQLLHHLGGK